MTTPELHLHTAYVLNDEGRILATREPGAQGGPLFTLVRSATECAWAVRVDLPPSLARELDRIAGEEPPTTNLRAAPLHAGRYVELLRPYIGGADLADRTRGSGGPNFVFPAMLEAPHDVVGIDDERTLMRHFRGWVPGEIAAGRAPVLALLEDGAPVSACFCARRSERAAEAGLETAAPFRGRGFGPRVTAAWALAMRAMGLTPLYSTAWTNTASLAVARKLGLLPYACSWGLSD